MRDYGSLRLRAEIGIGEKPYGSAEGGGLQEVIGLSKAYGGGRDVQAFPWAIDFARYLGKNS